MTSEKLYEVFGDISDQHIKEAHMTKAKSKKPVWTRWGTVAACFVLVAAMGVGIFQSGMFGTKTDIATLENGEKITFVKSDALAALVDLNVTIRKLTDEEIQLLFTDLPITANAYFDPVNHRAVGFEGKIGDVKLVVSTSGTKLLDTVIDGSEYTSTVSDVPITAGYFVTGANKTAIYYAAFDIGTNSVYVEYSGAQNDSENIKKELVNTIQLLIENGNFDLSKVTE